MAIQSIYQGATGNAGQTANNSSTLDMTEFLKLLTVQLSSQDPLDPTSDSEFFAQLAQMGTVQGVEGIQNTMQVTQAASLMGKTVTGITVDPATGASVSVTGTVTKLTISNGQYLLDVKGKNGAITELPLGNLQTVSQ